LIQQRWAKREIPMRRSLALKAVLILLVAMLTACGPQQPLKLGFISGQTGPFSDLGAAGLNGAILAVEENNRQPKTTHQVTLIIRDDEHNSVKARMAFQSLMKEEVAAVVGPMTSAIATELAPLANEAQVVLMGGTVVTDQLSGQDDYFLRAIASTRYYAAYSAGVHHQRLKPKRVLVVFDAANRDYAENWAKTYTETLRPLGVQHAEVIEIDSRSPQYSPTQTHARILQNNPDLVTFATSARTAASLILTLREQRRDLRFAVSAWAANRLLLEQAGGAAEGMLVEQYHDLFDSSPAYQSFATRFRQRFNHDPDYAAVIAYDATSLVLNGLGSNPRRAGLKEALIAQRNFKGLQTTIELDRYGDTARTGFTTLVLNGKFAPLERLP
jgi:branched-chain amino acid transport system substrate-binding protein